MMALGFCAFIDLCSAIKCILPGPGLVSLEERKCVGGGGGERLRMMVGWGR